MPRQRSAIFGFAIVAIVLALAASRPVLAQTVNVNTASQAELAGVKGIGKKLAAKIVAQPTVRLGRRSLESGGFSEKDRQNRADVEFRGWRRTDFRRGSPGRASLSCIACHARAYVQERASRDIRGSRLRCSRRNAAVAWNGLGKCED